MIDGDAETIADVFSAGIDGDRPFPTPTVGRHGEAAVVQLNVMAGDLSTEERPDEPCTVESILTRHGKRLYNLAYRICGDAELAEDLLQESMIEIMKALPRFRGMSSPYTWAYKVTLRTSLRHMRDADARANAVAALSSLDRAQSSRDGPIADPRNDVAGAAESRDPVDELVEKALIAEIREKCHWFVTFRLTDEQRVTLLLRDLFEFSYRDVAYLLDVSEDVVRSRLARARDNLRRHFAERCSWIDPKNPCRCESRAAYALHTYPSLAKTLAVRTGRPEYNRQVADRIAHTIESERDIVGAFPMLDFKGRKTLEHIIKNRS